MAQIITDDFNRTNSTGLGANWTTSATCSAFNVSSNQAVSQAASQDQSVYTGASWTGGNDQYAEAAIITKASGKDASIIARGATGGQTGYFFEINQNDAAVALGSSMSCAIYRVVGSAFTLLGSASSFVVSSNDVIRIEAQGTSITAKLNGTIKFGPTTDSGIASGNPAINAGNTPALGSIVFDNFAAGDFTVVNTNTDAPLLRPATMGFRTGLGGLIVGKFQQRVYPQLNSVTIASISGSAIATATASGALTGTGALSGAAIARTTVTGTTTGTGSLSGAAIARATVSGNGTTLNPISGATIATAITAGTVTGKGALTGSAIVTVLANGATTGKGALTGAAIVSAITTGTATGKGGLSGQAIAGATVACAVTSASTATQFSGAAICTVTVNGAVTGTGAISGASHWQGSRFLVRLLAKVLLLVRPSSMFRPLDLLPMSQRRILAVRQCVESMCLAHSLMHRHRISRCQRDEVLGLHDLGLMKVSTVMAGSHCLAIRCEVKPIQKTRLRTHGLNLPSQKSNQRAASRMMQTGRFGLSEFRFSAEASVTHEINSRTKLPTPSIQAEASLSYEDREEEAIIAAILGYEN
jgi:hypothetical protein